VRILENSQESWHVRVAVIQGRLRIDIRRPQKSDSYLNDNPYQHNFFGSCHIALVAIKYHQNLLFLQI
jgi:hypothetical protein